jgi:hypothetical protein
MPIAINIFQNQISMTGGIPFAVTLLKAPISINAKRLYLSSLFLMLYLLWIIGYNQQNICWRLL